MPRVRVNEMGYPWKALPRVFCAVKNRPAKVQQANTISSRRTRDMNACKPAWDHKTFRGTGGLTDGTNGRVRRRTGGRPTVGFEGGWETGSRTPIERFRAACPTIERSPSRTNLRQGAACEVGDATWPLTP